MEIISKSSRETVHVGRELSGKLKKGDIVSVYGELGTGKTRMIQGICKGLNVKERVTSPTFTLINEYKGRERVYHFDFYRITRVEEAQNLGCEDYFYNDGICLIEWPEKIEHLLPDNRITITIKYYESKKNWRKIKISMNR